MANADWTVIAKNNSGSNVVLEDLGIEIANTAQITLSDYFGFGDIADSASLQAAVAAGNIVINDGSVDLSSANGVNFIRRDNVYVDLQTHYTKSELATPHSTGLVDWTNITNVPSFGSPDWTEPVKYLVKTVATTAPATPTTGMVYVDTDDNHYYMWNGTTWVDKGSAATGDRIVDKNAAPPVVKTFNGTAWISSATPADNTAVMVNDDGDGGNAQYIYSSEQTKWIKIGDVNFEDHLDGGPNKHDASEIDVEGTYSVIGGPTDLETVLSNINSQMVTALISNTLDMSYDQGGSGAGRLIQTDSGPVKLDCLAATTAPLELVPKAALPTTGLANGQLAVKDGILCIYDSTRGKWLSVQRQTFVFGRAGTTKNQYLNFGAGSLASNNSGYRMPRNATIVGISGQLDASGTCTMNIRFNDTATNSVVLTITGAIGAADISTNIDCGATDFLQAYLATATAGVEDPVMFIEIAWRP